VQPAAERRPRPRIEGLADLIFGLSLSVGSIALIANPPASTTDILSHMAAFGFTFLILITAWLIYTTDMSVLPVETKSITFLNVPLLLLVAVVPYLLNITELGNSALSAGAASSIMDFASSLFGLDLTGILVILALFAHVISVEENRLVDSEHARLFRDGRNRMVILAVVMAISVAPIFWQVTAFGVPLRLYVWYIPLVSYWVGRAVRPESRSYSLKPEKQPVS
jgi:uncharacterized membrane protein